MAPRQNLEGATWDASGKTWKCACKNDCTCNEKKCSERPPESLCEHSYKNRQGMEQHLARVHNIGEKQVYTCDACGKAFDDASNHKRHSSKCQGGNQKGARGTGFVCFVAGCDYATKGRRDNFKRHLKTKHNFKNDEAETASKLPMAAKEAQLTAEEDLSTSFPPAAETIVVPAVPALPLGFDPGCPPALPPAPAYNPGFNPGFAYGPVFAPAPAPVYHPGFIPKFAPAPVYHPGFIPKFAPAPAPAPVFQQQQILTGPCPDHSQQGQTWFPESGSSSTSLDQFVIDPRITDDSFLKDSMAWLENSACPPPTQNQLPTPYPSPLSDSSR